MKVRVNSLYVYNPVLIDRIDGRTNLQKGDIVRVINLHGCPPANTMGQCYVADPDTNIVRAALKGRTMSLLGEEVVEEWLNRNGYFTIRGIKVGADEIDILAIRPLPNGQHECRHIEVQVSINPISYITKVPAAIRRQTGIGAHNAKKRDTAQLIQGVQEWVEVKFNQSRKIELRNLLCAGSWTKELVVGAVKHEEELDLLRKAGVTIRRLKDILAEMVEKPSVVKAAAGADLYDLMLLRE